MNSTENGKRVTLTYQPHGGYASERIFDGVTEDDMVFTVAALVGRRCQQPRPADATQLRNTRYSQMGWYADRMIEALYEAGGRWVKLIPMRVRLKIVQALMDYLREITGVWTDELIGMHAEVTRSKRPAPVLRARSAPESGPRIRCTDCESWTLLAVELPHDWSTDVNGLPHCPKHPVISLTKEPVG